MLLLLLSLLAGACHIQTQLLHGGGLGVKLAHDLALVHYKDAVRKVHHLVQLKADQQHGLALVALGEDAPVQISESGTKVAVGLTVPEDLKLADDTMTRTYTVLYMHDGVVSEIAGYTILQNQGFAGNSVADLGLTAEAVTEAERSWADQSACTWAVCEPTTGELLAEITLDPATREISVRTRAGFDEAAATGVESVRRFAAAMLD